MQAVQTFQTVQTVRAVPGPGPDEANFTTGCTRCPTGSSRHRKCKRVYSRTGGRTLPCLKGFARRGGDLEALGVRTFTFGHGPAPRAPRDSQGFLTSRKDKA